MSINAIAANYDEIVKINEFESRREKVMSLMKLNLSVSYFNINIHIRRDEERKNQNLEKLYRYEQRVNEVMENRNNLGYQTNLYHMFR